MSWKPPSRVLVRSATWSVKKTYKRLFIMGADKSNKGVVVGAGLMGTGIAHALASSGRATVLVDPNAAALEKVNADLSEAAVGANLLVETVSEQLAIKKAVVMQAASLMVDNAIIASNTSALSVTEIAASVPAPERFIGMHFFNPVHKMKLVELVRGLATSDETVARVKD